MNVDLKQFEPITEDNKDELCAWMEENIDALSDPNYSGRFSRKVNRIFMTGKDDIDELVSLLGRFAATIQCTTFVTK